MNFVYEFVKYDKNIPGKILMQDKPGWRCNTMPHWHSELEFVYMISGSLKVTRNGISQTIQPGEFYFCNSKAIHSTVTPDNASNYKYIVLLLSRDFLLRFHADCMFEIPAGTPLENLKAQLEHLVRLSDGSCGPDFRRNLDIEKNKVLLEICQILVTDCAAEPVRRSCDMDGTIGHAKSVMEYVRQNYDKPLSLPVIADKVGLSPQYLSKYFRKVTGLGISRYINLVRLEHANEELLNDNITVVEAALNNGFANVKAYAALCREVYGITPMKFRKIARGETVQAAAPPQSVLPV